MTLKKAIEVLRTYQAWRIGEEDVDMQKPSVVTEAINTLLDFTDSDEFFAVESMPKITDAEIIKKGQAHADRNGPCYESEWIDKNNSFIIGARWYREQLKQKYESS